MVKLADGTWEAETFIPGEGRRKRKPTMRGVNNFLVRSQAVGPGERPGTIRVPGEGPVLKSNQMRTTGNGKAIVNPGPNSGVKVSTDPDSPWVGTITVDHGSTSSEMNTATGERIWYDGFGEDRREVTSWRVETINNKFPTGADGERDAEAVWSSREGISNLMADFYATTDNPAIRARRSERLRVSKRSDGGWAVSLYDQQGDVGIVNADGSWQLSAGGDGSMLEPNQMAGGRGYTVAEARGYTDSYLLDLMRETESPVLRAEAKRRGLL